LLKKGRNEIRIVAYDVDQLSSEKAVYVMRRAEKSEIWAVAIGINDYQHVAKLKYATNDARSFYNYLVTDFGVKHDHITFLLMQRPR
jgi:hypothetical protein